ncbi:hypothetical protein SDC9_58196 [bioreactor metagenome]|uniref:Uncharacterized protein n=1 Tax=bioreactor metagenome TaxID=1076179 RepID=A0A644X6S3_9ZZZZ
MLDDDDRLISRLGQFIDQGDGGPPRLRIEIGQRLIEEQDLHIIDEHPGKRDSLLLPA